MKPSHGNPGNPGSPEIESLFLDPTRREIEPQGRAIGCSIARVKSVDAERRSITAIVSTPNVDRYEEIVEPAAFEPWLKVFMTNPVFCAGHTYVGWNGEATVIGHWESIRVTPEGLEAVCLFAATPLAEDYWTLYRDGHMKAFSVGWITHGYKMQEFEMAPGVKKVLRVFTEVELIEISAVAIPANRESLVRAASAFRGLGRRISSEGKKCSKCGEMFDGPGEVCPDCSDGGEASVKGGRHETIARAVHQEIAKQLNTDPGGPLHMLIADVVEQALGHSDHGCLHDVGEDGGAPAPGSDQGRVSQLLQKARSAIQEKK